MRKEFDVTVGSYPGENVRLKVRGPDEGVVEETAAWLRERVESPEE